MGINEELEKLQNLNALFVTNNTALQVECNTLLLQNKELEIENSQLRTAAMKNDRKLLDEYAKLHNKITELEKENSKLKHELEKDSEHIWFFATIHEAIESFKHGKTIKRIRKSEDPQIPGFIYDSETLQFVSLDSECLSFNDILDYDWYIRGEK